MDIQWLLDIGDNSSTPLMRLRDIGDPSYEWFLRREATLLATLSRPWESRPATVEEIGAILKTLAVDQRSRWDLMQIWHLGGEGPREVQKLLANLIKNRLSTSNPSKYISAGAAEARRYLQRPGYDHPDFWGWLYCRLEDKKGLDPRRPWRHRTSHQQHLGPW